MLPRLWGKFQLNPACLSLHEPLNEQLTWASPNRQWPNFKPYCRHPSLAAAGDGTLARWTSAVATHSSVPLQKPASEIHECLSRLLQASFWVSVMFCCVFPTPLAVQGCVTQKEPICQWDKGLSLVLVVGCRLPLFCFQWCLKFA